MTSLRNLYYEDRTGNIDGWQFLTKLTISLSLSLSLSFLFFCLLLFFFDLAYSLDHLGIAFRSQIDLPQICSLFPTLTHLTQLKTLLFNPIFFSSADTEYVASLLVSVSLSPLSPYIVRFLLPLFTFPIESRYRSSKHCNA